jgi:hypothetical protein
MLPRLLLACLLLAACAAPQAPARALSGGASCALRGPLPDAACTPGATDGAVTAANLADTVCRPGYTRTVRPPVAYTDTLKRRQMAAYGESGPASGYEEDHLIPLELGGSPRDSRNLWPEPRDALLPGQGAEAKDRLENALNSEVCAGRLELGAAQRAIAGDWWQAYRTYVTD